MTGTCLALVSTRKQFLEATILLQLQVKFHSISTLVVQNKRSTQEKYTATNITIQQITKSIESNKSLEVIYYKGLNHLHRNFKGIVIVVDYVPPFEIRYIPQGLSSLKSMPEMINTIQSQP